MSKAISLTGLSEFLKKCKEIFVEKEDKYIIIDWEGKDQTDVTKKAEVDAQLKNIYLANPLALLSVVFKHYGENVVENSYYPIIGVNSEMEGTDLASVVFFDIFNNEVATFNFSIE